MSTGFPTFTPATIIYEGTYKGARISGRVPVWSIPNTSVDAARLVHVVVTGRTLTPSRALEWHCGMGDFVAWSLARGKRISETPFLRFTFRIEANPNRSVPREVAPITFNPPSECDEVAASMSDKAPHFVTFDEACQWVRARMPGESCTIIDNTAESLMSSQRRGVRVHPSDKAPTPAPTFTDDVPEPAFDILSDESGKGARSVVIFRRMGLDVVDFIASSSLLSSHKIPGDVLAWQSFRTDDGWSWYRSGQWIAKDSAGLFLP